MLLQDPAISPLAPDASGILTYSGTGTWLQQLAAHESGAPLGLAEGSDPASIMNHVQTATNRTPDAADVAAIDSLYGAPGSPSAPTLRSSPESGERAAYDGAKRKKGSKLHLAVDTLGHVLALHVTPANVDDRAEVERLVDAVQDATAGSVEVAFADQGYNGERAEAAAKAHGIELVIVRLPEAKKGFVLLPTRWVAERSLAWTTRFRRLVRDYERYASTLAGLHFVALACLMLKQAALLMASS